MVTPENITTDIIEVAKSFNQDFLTTAIYRQYGKYSQGTLTKHFGSMANAFVAAGLKLCKGTSVKLSKDKIISNLIRWSESISKTEFINIKDFYSYDPPHNRDILTKYFGSVWDAAEAANLSFKQNITKEDIVCDLKFIAGTSNHLSESDYRKKGNFSYHAVIKLFGSWLHAKKEAGLTAKRSSTKKYSKEIILAYFRAFFVKNGRIPTHADFENVGILGHPSASICYDYFPNKSWKEIVILAGLPQDGLNIGRDGKIYDSAAEAKIADKLYSNFIEFESHKKVIDNRMWTCDFYLPESGLWIEYDGLEEFRNKKNIYDEKIQFYQANNYKYIVLTGKNNIIEKANLYLDTSTLEVRRISNEECQNFLSRVHYLGKSPNSSRLYGGFCDGKLSAVCAIGLSANIHETAICINRICWSDQVRNNKNFGSMFVSKVLKVLKSEGFTGEVVSWSDPRYHTGTLYKACNFTKVPIKNRSDYIYIDVHGNEYHKSKCRVKAGESEADKAKFLGLTKVPVPPKTKWRILV